MCVCMRARACVCMCVCVVVVVVVSVIVKRPVLHLVRQIGAQKILLIFLLFTTE